MKPNPLNLQIVPKRYAVLVMPFLLSVIMTCVVSCVSTLRSVGMDGFSVGMWLSAWLVSWLIAFPVLLLALPVVKRLTFMLVKSD